MPNPEKMTAAVNAYIDAFAKGDPDQVANLFAERGSTVEDPIGSPIHNGREAIRAFYAASMGGGAKLTLERPVGIAGDYAAFSFSVNLPTGQHIDVIDTFKFDGNDQIVEMRAFWGPTNMHGF